MSSNPLPLKYQSMRRFAAVSFVRREQARFEGEKILCRNAGSCRPPLSSFHLRNIFLNVWVLHLAQFMRAAFKNGLAFPKDHEAGADILRWPSVGCFHVPGGRIKVVRGQGECVL
jgi:hypothetical protein